MADLKPYRLLRALSGEYWFDGTFPRDVADAVVAASRRFGIPIELGRTVAGNEFFLEQLRLDGAIRLETPGVEDGVAGVRSMPAGVRNIEMEGAMLAGYLNHWGFPRVRDDLHDHPQPARGRPGEPARSAELDQFRERSGDVLFNYLTATLG